MVNFIVWVAVISTLLCGLIVFVIVGLVAFDVSCALLKRRKRKALPDPDPRADRTFGQKYFERAVGRTPKN